MAARIHDLRAQLGALVKEANGALEAAQKLAKDAGRELSTEELAAQDAFDAKIEAKKKEIALEERKLDRERAYGSTSTEGSGAAVPGSGLQVRQRAEDDPKRGFGSHREFFVAVMDNSGLRDRADVADDRLQPLAVVDKDDKTSKGELAFMMPTGFGPRAAVGSDEQGGYSDSVGGFSVASSRLPGLLQRGFEGDPTAGLTMNVPMATPSVEIMARTDSDHTTSVSGGFTVARRAETSAGSSSRMQLEMVGLKAAMLFGLAYATEEILQDSAITFAAMIDQGFRTQFGAAILNEKLRGLGGDQYVGVIGASGTVSISKETNQAAATVVYDNVLKMRARCWGYGQAVWLANHDCFPQLAKLALAIGTGGVPVYQPSPSVDRPDMLLGRPVVYSEFCETLGTVGDLILGNWSQYLEGTYEPVQGAESIHVRFVNHERTFKLWTRNAGAPWWRAALTPKKGSNTLSPFITLATRS